MKKTLVKLIDNIQYYLYSNLTNARKTFYELDQINFKQSAEFINEQGGTAVLLSNKKVFWKHAINEAPKEGLVMEFGVFQGNSINYFSQILKSNKDSRKIYGFDSFEGLSEDWSGTHMLKSTFDQKGKMPDVHDNVKLIKGWIDETLPPFLQEKMDDSKIAFMHIDMDTYSPTKIIFEETVKLLKVGTIIVFDELLGYSGWKNNEYKALTEIIEPEWDYEFIAFCEPKDKARHISKYVRASVKITGRKAKS